MGCFNTSGCLSQLPILGGQEVVCFIGCYHLKGSSGIICYPTDYIAPFTLPIYGRYNDYGSITDIQRDTNVELLEKYFNLDIESIFDAVARLDVDGYTPQEEIDRYTKYDETHPNTSHQKEIDTFTKLLLLNKCYPFESENYRFKLCFEHKAIWEGMIAQTPTDKIPQSCYYDNIELFRGFATWVNNYNNFIFTLPKELKKLFILKMPNPFDSSQTKEGIWNLEYGLKTIVDYKNLSEDIITRYEDFKKNNEIKDYFFSGYNRYFMRFYTHLSFEDKIKFCTECSEEAEKFQRLYYFLCQIPMAFIPSPMGSQDFDYENYCKAINVIKENAEKIAEKRLEE